MRLSAHFTSEEFTDGGGWPTAWPHPDLVNLLEEIRSRVGRPIVIVSGCRSPNHNVAVGGVPGSMHLLGRAADIPPGILPVALADELRVPGVGRSGGWAVHVDVGPAGRRWSY